MLYGKRKNQQNTVLKHKFAQQNARTQPATTNQYQKKPKKNSLRTKT